jgi:hypothetical protein
MGMGFEINIRFGRLGINTTDALIDIKTRMPAVEARSRLPRVRIDTQHVQVSIDQKQCFAEVGLKPADVFAKEVAQKSWSKGLKAIAAIARKGDTLARVDKNPNAIPALAKGIMGKRLDYTVAALPRSRPKISFSGGVVDINWDKGYVQLQAFTARPEITATRAGVDVYMLQKAAVDIAYTRDGFDTTI